MLRLSYHPFSSFCQKVLIALYEREVPFEGVLIDLGDPVLKAKLEAVWPLAKFPVLEDEAAGLVVPESSAIIEYLDRFPSEAPPLRCLDADAALQANIWDRFIDNYVEVPMQKVIGDNFRPENRRDPHGVEDARTLLLRSYKILDEKLATVGEWLVGDAFTLADCSAAPALFYANIAAPMASNPNLEAYYTRLLARPSFARVIEEARPYRRLFPLEWPESYR